MVKVMRDLVPVPGDQYRKLILVDLKPGEEVREHEHSGHSLLYYPFDAGPILIQPTAGVMVYLPPGTRHAVPPVEDGRVSFAMIVNQPEKSPQGGGS